MHIIFSRSDDKKFYGKVETILNEGHKESPHLVVENEELPLLESYEKDMTFFSADGSFGNLGAEDLASKIIKSCEQVDLPKKIYLMHDNREYAESLQNQLAKHRVTVYVMKPNTSIDDIRGDYKTEKQMLSVKKVRFTVDEVQMYDVDW